MVSRFYLVCDHSNSLPAMLSLVASLAFPPLPSILSCDERRLLETGDGQTETQTICITSPELDTIMYPSNSFVSFVFTCLSPAHLYAFCAFSVI